MPKRPLVVALALGSAICAPIPVFSQPPSPPTIAIRAARLIDGTNPAPLPNGVVLVQGDKITAVGSGLPIPPNATLIDLGDSTILPGLIDSHTHLLTELDLTTGSSEELATLIVVATQSTAERALLGARSGREDLEAGITTVRDLGNSGMNGDVALRNAINRGWLPGPRVLASTRALAAPGGQFVPLTPEAQPLIEQEYATIHGPESARQAVRSAINDGADCIKVIVNGRTTVTPAEMQAIVEEAHRSRRKVAAHATDDSAVRLAVEAGADSIEHGYSVSDAVLKTMAQKHIFLVPTDHTAQAYFEVQYGTRQPSPEERKQAAGDIQSLVARLHDRLQRALKLGVPIAAGSDNYVNWPQRNRGQSSIDTLIAYAEAGMPPTDILQAATRNAAELLGMQDRIGTLQPGKYADIIAVPGDPLKDVNLLMHASFVMKGGTIVKQPNR